MAMAMVNQSTRGQKFFVVDTESEISKLPTLTSAGQDNLISVKSASQGSTARVIETGKTYMLNGNGVWKEITSSGGGGGGVDPSDLATETDIDNLFNK